MNDNKDFFPPYNTDPKAGEERKEAIDLQEAVPQQTQTSCTAPTRQTASDAQTAPVQQAAPAASEEPQATYQTGTVYSANTAGQQNGYGQQPGAVYQTGGTGYPAGHTYSANQSGGAYGSEGTGYPAQGVSAGSAAGYPAGGSYTWGNGSGQTPSPPYTAVPKKPKKEKKHGRHFGVKVVAVVLVCLLVSFGSVGTFALLLQNGVIAVNSGANENAAFTINKVIEATTDASKISSTVSAKTPQEIAEALIPSVVCIQNYQPASANNPFGAFGGFEGNGNSNGSDSQSMLPVDPTSQGSGIVYSADGYIITNAHVIADASKIKVITSDGKTYEAEVVGADSLTDLAVIRVINTEDKFTPAEFGSADDLKVADSVMAIGNPGGIEFNSTVTMGYVSALDRDVVDNTSGYTMKCIQTDAAINPGNSGGALVNMYGQVVGINSSKIVATGYEGLGFAIPINTAQPIISDLMKYGYVKDRAMLGISGQYVDEMTARFYGLSSGMYVAQLNSDQAKSSGLKEGDVITAVDNTTVTSATTLSTFLLTKKPGDTVKLTVNRAQTKETLTISLTLTENKGG